MVNKGFFLIVRLMHKFSESISGKARSHFPCYDLNLDQNSVVFWANSKSLQTVHCFHKVKKFLTKGRHDSSSIRCLNN